MRISLPPTIQVSDCLTGSIAASSVFQAFDYALRMGAHVVSCSFGASYEYGFAPTAPAPSYHAQWTAAYVAALQPLASKVGVPGSGIGGYSRGGLLVSSGQSVMDGPAAAVGKGCGSLGGCLCSEPGCYKP